MKDEFLAMVSHELRTPLSAILLWAGLAGRQQSKPADVASALRAIGVSARAQSMLVDDLLDASRMIAGKLHIAPRVTGLVPVVRAAVAVVQPSADDKGVRLELVTTAPADQAAAPLDPARIQQVLWNLLDNAVKFTPKGGTVRASVTIADGAALIQITDTGRGIPAESLPHVFERFRQADEGATRAHGGLGLGLAISRELVELHGGTLCAASAGLQHGATFTVRLPLA